MNDIKISNQSDIEKRRNPQTVIDRLLADNMGFVVTLAKDYSGKGLDMDDLVSEGVMGMLEAAAKFDTTKGNSFVGYAAPFVRKNMQAAIELQNSLYKVPRKERTRQTDRQKKAVSIDAPLSEGNHFSLLDILVNADSPVPDYQVNRDRVIAEIKSCFSVLDEREREVVVNFYGLEHPRMTLAEIGAKLGVKRERARQIRDKAIRKIARQTKNGALRHFLHK